MTKMSDVLEEINSAGPDHSPSTARAASIKDSISSAYDMVAEIWDQGDILNWGMDDPGTTREIESLIPGFAEFDTDGFSEQLYFCALRGVPLERDEFAGKKILEVGSGLGAGLNFLSRCVPGAVLTGVDLSESAVRRANGRFARVDSLRFLPGDAEDLPFEDAAFDVVVSVESSHNYPDLGRFHAEVGRVLKPGGHFSLVDFYTEQRGREMASLKPAAQHLEWLPELDISERVKAAVRQRMAPGSHMRQVLANKRMPSVHRVVALHCMMAIFGGKFAGSASDGFVARMSRRIGALTLMEDVPIVSYRRHVARRP